MGGNEVTERLERARRDAARRTPARTRRKDDRWRDGSSPSS